MKSLTLAILASWVVLFATDFLIHHFWLGPDYEATKPIWRSDEEINTRIHWMFVAQFLSVATFVIVWAKGFAGRSVGTGAMFGFLMGLFQQIWVLVNYVMIPIPSGLAVKWYFAGLAQAVILGIVASVVYKPVLPSAP